MVFFTKNNWETFPTEDLRPGRSRAHSKTSWPQSVPRGSDPSTIQVLRVPMCPIPTSLLSHVVHFQGVHQFLIVSGDLLQFLQTGLIWTTWGLGWSRSIASRWHFAVQPWWSADLGASNSAGEVSWMVRIGTSVLTAVFRLRRWHQLVDRIEDCKALMADDGRDWSLWSSHWTHWTMGSLWDVMGVFLTMTMNPSLICGLVNLIGSQKPEHCN